MRRILLVLGVAVVVLGVSSAHHHPAIAQQPASSSVALFDQNPACTNDLESEFDQAAQALRTTHPVTTAIPVPASCSGLSHTQVQTLANEISGNDAQAQAFAQAFANAFSQAMNQGTGAQAS